ncbi:hypothetical protein PanWU01x14_330340, partial [Parasponia andersonii]
MAAVGEIPMVVDVQSRRRKSIFWIICLSLVGNQKGAHRPDHSTGSENRQEVSVVVKCFQ